MLACVAGAVRELKHSWVGRGTLSPVESSKYRTILSSTDKMGWGTAEQPEKPPLMSS